eukprot:s1480_g13.t1
MIETHPLVSLLQWAFSALSAVAVGPSKAAISKAAVQAQPLAQQPFNRLQPVEQPGKVPEQTRSDTGRLPLCCCRCEGRAGLHRVHRPPGTGWHKHWEEMVLHRTSSSRNGRQRVGLVPCMDRLARHRRRGGAACIVSLDM